MPGLAPLGEYLRYAVTLTAVLDPFFAVPIFVSVTARRSSPLKKSSREPLTALQNVRFAPRSHHDERFKASASV